MAKPSSKKSVFCLIFTLFYGVSSNTIPAATNGEVTLKVNMGGQIDEILWKRIGNKMVEMDSKDAEPTEYLAFIGRTVLDKKTGDVTIKNLTKADSGVYDAEVVIQGRLTSISRTIKVIDPVTEAKITCDSDANLATIHCEANGDSLSYSWSRDGIQIAEMKGQTGPQISKEKDLNSVYSCMVKNQVSDKSVTYQASDCFTSDAGSVGPIVGGVVGVLVLLASSFAVYKWRRPKQKNLKKSTYSLLLAKDPLIGSNEHIQKGKVHEENEALEGGNFGKCNKSNEALDGRHGKQNVEKGGWDMLQSTSTKQNIKDIFHDTTNTANNREGIPGKAGNADEVFKNTHEGKDIEMEERKRSGKVNEDTSTQTPDTQHSPDNRDNIAADRVSREDDQTGLSLTSDKNPEKSHINQYNCEKEGFPSQSDLEQKTEERFGSPNSDANKENRSEKSKCAFNPAQPSSVAKSNSGHDCTDKNGISPPDPAHPEAQHRPTLDNSPKTKARSTKYEGMTEKPENADEVFKNTHGGRNIEMEKGGWSVEVNQDTCTPAQPVDTQHS